MCNELGMFSWLIAFRHRKPNVDNDGKPESPRKAIATDGTFGTMF